MNAPIKTRASLFGELPSTLWSFAFIAGGAVRALFDGTDVKDIDVFFRSNDDYSLAIDLMSDHAGFKCIGSAGRTLMFENRNNGVLVNLVGFDFGDEYETIQRFDFRCCQLALTWNSVQPILRAEPKALEDCRAKNLRVLNNNGTERTLRRIEHYIEDYGYTLDAVHDADVAHYDVPSPEVFAPHELVPPRARAHIANLPSRGGGY